VGSLDRYEWWSQAPLIALVVSRADFSVRRFELPNGGVFHLGKAGEEQGVEFPSFDRRFTGERTALTVLMQTSLSQRYGADRVLAVTAEQVQAYSYGPDWLAEEHLYVPRPNGPQAQPPPWRTGQWRSWRYPAACRWDCMGSLWRARFNTVAGMLGRFDDSINILNA
jgi:carotenoid cleavage dioxygenase-like enzyme